MHWVWKIIDLRETAGRNDGTGGNLEVPRPWGNPLRPHPGQILKHESWTHSFLSLTFSVDFLFFVRMTFSSRGPCQLATHLADFHVNSHCSTQPNSWKYNQLLINLFLLVSGSVSMTTEFTEVFCIGKCRSGMGKRSPVSCAIWDPWNLQTHSQNKNSRKMWENSQKFLVG